LGVVVVVVVGVVILVFRHSSKGVYFFKWTLITFNCKMKTNKSIF